MATKGGESREGMERPSLRCPRPAVFAEGMMANQPLGGGNFAAILWYHRPEIPTGER